MEMIEKRISDGSVLQLIRKWIQVGVIDEGRLLVSETGTGQGQTISPLLANIYLHHVLDEWFEEVVKPRLRSEAHEIRFTEERLIEAVCKIRFDASPGEDKARGIWPLCGGTSEEAGEETQHLRLSRFYVSLRP